MARQPSRPKKWEDAVAAALAALEHLEAAVLDLEGLRQEYAEWRDNLPDSLDSTLAEKLDAVVELEIPDLVDVVDTMRPTLDAAEAADLPLGFGRD